MTRAHTHVREHIRSLPGRSIKEQAMFLSLASETGRVCPIPIEPRTMDQVIAAALELELAAFGAAAE